MHVYLRANILSCGSMQTKHRSRNTNKTCYTVDETGENFYKNFKNSTKLREL